MRAKPAKKVASVTPFWLDAFLVVCIVHLALAAWLQFTGWTFMSAEWSLSFKRLETWLVLVLPPYALLLVLMLIWKERRQRILIVGGAVLWAILANITARYGP
jgi:hypothetical protein